MQGGPIGNFIDRGPTEMYPWTQAGQVGMGNIYGPSAGQAVAQRATVSPRGMATQASSSFFTIPIMLAFGVLVWYALKTFD